MAEEEQGNASLIPQQRLCFDVDNPPSCTTPPPRTTGNHDLALLLGEQQQQQQQQPHQYDAQQYCFLMAREFFRKVGVNPLELHRHMEAFTALPLENETCTAFRQVYHLCYWCSPLASIDYVYVPPFCDLDRPPPSTVEDDVSSIIMNVTAACQEIRRVRQEKVQFLATIELCDWQRKIGHLCVDTCRNADPSKGCFSKENPPSCNPFSHYYDDADDNQSNVTAKIEFDAQTTCASLEQFYLWPNLLETHGTVLVKVHADSEYCQAIRAFYHECYWCITTYNNSSTITLPGLAKDYCKMDCFNVSQDDPADAFIDVAAADMNDTCEELNSIIQRKQTPSTIDLCESYRQMGHLCPQLACGKYSYTSSESCFSEENVFPTCEANVFPSSSLNEGDNMVSMDHVQHTCFILASEYLMHTDIWNVSAHAKGLSMIRIDSELCDATKQFYHLCHWCSQDAVIKKCSKIDCFTLDPPLVMDSSVNVTSACRELTTILQQEELPATADLCYKYNQVSHLCPAVCGNYNYQPEEGCFTMENAPSCSAPGNDDILLRGLDEQKICNTVFVDYLDKNNVTFNTTAHLSILSKISAHSEFCAAVRSVYHRCFWCEPYAAQGACSQQPPPVPYCSAPLALLRANVHHHEICVELEQVYTNYSATGPMTIDLCQGLEHYGDVCPKLCKYMAGWNFSDDGEVVTVADERPEPCFKTAQDFPNCSATVTDISNDMVMMDEEEVQHLCFLLEREFYNDISREEHEEILPNIRANTKLCYAAKHVYHLCYWCTPTTKQCNPVRKVCEPIPPEMINDPEEASKLSAACTKLKALRDKREWSASNTMCNATNTYESFCRDVCENGSPEQGCFNYDHNPPTCQATRDSGDPIVKYDVQDTCYTLLVDYLYPKNVVFDLSSHGQVLMAIHEDSELCPAARQAYHLCYWCDAELREYSEDFCSFDCSSPVHIFEATVDIGDVCQELKSLNNTGEWPATMDLCHRLRQVGHLCPGFCEAFDPTFIQAPNAKSMVSLSRTAAILSLLGSAFILWDVLSSPKNRATVYHQLLGAMAVFDIVTAVAWIFARMPIPKEASFYVPGAVGTQQTCKAQAFFVQLGFTSVMYNVSLSFYYVLVIVMGSRESDLRKKRLIMHGLPLVVGVGLAFAGMPFYHWYVYGCHLLPPPNGELWTVLVFAVIPLSFSVLSITVSMLVVYLTVRRKARTSQRWSMGVGNTSLEAEVFRQALLYTLSFYITWPIFFSVYIASTDYKIGYDKGRYALPAIVSFVAPLQGFTNFLVYIRPRFSCSCRSRVTLFSSAFSRFVGATSSERLANIHPSAALAAPDRPGALKRSSRSLFHNNNNNAAAESP